MILKKFNNDSARKYQEGGEMVPAGAAPMESAPVEGPQAGGQEEQLQQIAGQLLESLLQQIGDPNVVAAILQLALEMLQQAAGGQQGQPVFKKGGKLCKNVKKANCGIKIKK